MRADICPGHDGLHGLDLLGRYTISQCSGGGFDGLESIFILGHELRAVCLEQHASRMHPTGSGKCLGVFLQLVFFSAASAGAGPFSIGMSGFGLDDSPRELPLPAGSSVLNHAFG